MKVYIGYDEREHEAVRVATKTLDKATCGEIIPELLESNKLSSQGLLNRISDHRDCKDYDLVSNAYKSTRFAASRFLVPILCNSTWALFCDCDVLFLVDPRSILSELPKDAEDKAVYVVKHDLQPAETVKMVDQVQSFYRRKNWSSVMLFNCKHPSNRRLTLWDVNNRPGRDLHAFYWLDDNEIGELSSRWNWLVNVTEKPTLPGIAHFTLGGPWLENWQSTEHDGLWVEASKS